MVRAVLARRAARPEQISRSRGATSLAYCVREPWMLLSVASRAHVVGNFPDFDARTSLIRWRGCQEQFGRYLDGDQRQLYYDAARKFIDRYVALARQAIRPAS